MGLRSFNVSILKIFLLKTVNQSIELSTSNSTKKPSFEVDTFLSYKNFFLYMYSSEVDQGTHGYIEVANVTIGFNEDKISDYDGFGNR